MDHEHRSRRVPRDATITLTAWDPLVTRTYEANRIGLIAAASRIVGLDHAADVAQDAFVRVWSNPHAFDESRGTLTKFLYMVVRGTSVDRLRAISSQRTRDMHDTMRSTTTTAAEEFLSSLLASERRERVRRAIANLREAERESIIAAYFGHLTYREVAARLGLPEGTVKSRIRLGLVRLRHQLNRAD